MSTTTLLYIILAGIIALFLALFQYWFSAKQKGKQLMLYTFLRFISIFSLLLLLINPKFEQISFFNEKPNLVLVVDNSESVESDKKNFIAQIVQKSPVKKEVTPDKIEKEDDFFNADESEFEEF